MKRAVVASPSRKRRKKAPEFSDRVYDSTRAVPTPLERKLFNRCLARRRRLVREAARELISGWGNRGEGARGKWD